MSEPAKPDAAKPDAARPDPAGSEAARATAKADDSRNLIAESYRIEGIGAADCRSIFLDWALGLPAGRAPAEAAAALLDAYAPPAGHPMTALLREAAAGERSAPGGRRGGARGRR